MPKFYMSLGHNYGDHYTAFPSNLYGPFESDDALDEHIAKRWPNNTAQAVIVFEGEIRHVKPSPKEKPEHEKRAPGNDAFYIKNQAGEGYKCSTCDAAIMEVRVAHPVHLKEMPGAGFGECKYSSAPYCPNCEKKPNSHGAPVYESLADL